MVTADSPGVKAGDHLVALSQIELPLVGRIYIHEPLAPIVLLFAAREDEDRAVLRREKMFKSIPPDSSDARRPDDGAVIDTIRLATAAVVASMSSLEAFVAEILPDDAKFETVDKKDQKVVRDRDEIERWASIGEKIGEILPVVLGASTIKGTKLWESFERIRTLRNSVVHPKRSEIHTLGAEYDPKRVWSRILRGDFIGSAQMAEDVMEHFSPGYVRTIDAR